MNFIPSAILVPSPNVLAKAAAERGVNQNRVMSFMARQPPRTAPELVRLTGLSQRAVCHALAMLREAGLLYRSEYVTNFWYAETQDAANASSWMAQKRRCKQPPPPESGERSAGQLSLEFGNIDVHPEPRRHGPPIKARSNVIRLPIVGYMLEHRGEDPFRHHCERESICLGVLLDKMPAARGAACPKLCSGLRPVSAEERFRAATVQKTSRLG